MSFALLALSTPLFAADQCVDWQKVMSQTVTSTGKRVVVEPLEDQSKWPGDDWISLGLRDALSSLLKAGRDLSVASNNPDYIIRGVYSHSVDGLRVYFNLIDGKNSKLIQQFGYTASYPGHRDFFNKLKDTAKGIFDFLKIKFDEERLKRLAYLTDSTDCFASYSKGMQAFTRYDPKMFEVAAMWFKEAIRSDVHSPLGYLGLVDLLTFQAINNKGTKAPYSSYIQEAQNQYNLMKKNSRREIPIPPFSTEQTTLIKTLGFEKSPNRFLAADSAYTMGLVAAQSGNFQKARDDFKNATVLTPEDALAWLHLSRMNEKIGDSAQAANALNKAKEINRCITGQ